MVRSNDEWGDPSKCESRDQCQYCHTRTEQQFHPDIYKSTRCKDMQQSLFCPRGPFCAFAHDDDEAQIVHDISSVTYPDPASPSNSGVIGDRRERSYTHIGLIETRPRSSSNTMTDRARSYSLIESINNMSVTPAPLSAAAVAQGGPKVASAVPPGIVDSARNRSQSQGSADLGGSTNNLALPDHRENSPKTGAHGSPSNHDKMAAMEQVMYDQSVFEREYYNKQQFQQQGLSPANELQATSAAAAVMNGHFTNNNGGGVPTLPDQQQMMIGPVPPGPTNQSGAAVYPEQAEFMTEQSRRSVMIDRLIYQREQEKHQREALNKLKVLSASLVQHAHKLPMEYVVWMQQLFSKNLEEVNSVLAVRKQMSCVICCDRLRDALIIPCSHYAACQDCLRTQKYCPICKEVIQNIYPVTLFG
eukprot:sb/3465091/